MVSARTREPPGRERPGYGPKPRERGSDAPGATGFNRAEKGRAGFNRLRDLARAFRPGRHDAYPVELATTIEMGFPHTVGWQ